MSARRPKRRLDPAELRLPLIALIDVVLFLLMYFMIAGNLAAEERELSTTLAAQRTSAKGGGGGGRAITLQVLQSQNRGVYKIGDRVITQRTELVNVLSQLPKDGGIIIKANDDATVADAAAALQSCKDAGFIKISYVAGGT
ncbi:MAG: biopolymer transporter ExbD [Planctomycetes bacterium]|nr:biopolymer transporter ExbD [Planctomycetota bacterium]